MIKIFLFMKLKYQHAKKVLIKPISAVKTPSVTPPPPSNQSIPLHS
jgi:hypothetical protein